MEIPTKVKNNSNALVTDTAYKIGMRTDYDLNSFAANFRVSGEMYQALLDYGREQGEDAGFPDNFTVKDELKRFLKARLARQLYGAEGFFKVWIWIQSPYLEHI